MTTSLHCKHRTRSLETADQQIVGHVPQLAKPPAFLERRLDITLTNAIISHGSSLCSPENA